MDQGGKYQDCIGESYDILIDFNLHQLYKNWIHNIFIIPILVDSFKNIIQIWC